MVCSACTCPRRSGPGPVRSRSRRRSDRQPSQSSQESQPSPRREPPMIRPGLWRREFTVPLQNLQSELNRLIEGYWQSSGGSPSAAPVDLSTSVWSPSIDLFETPGELILVVDLPGVDPATIDLSLTGSV